MDFALQSRGYERGNAASPEVGLGWARVEDGGEGQLDSQADCSFLVRVQRSN
jgi:hypothetical protein